IAHGVEAWNIEKPALRRSLNSAELILAVSEYTRQRLIKEQNIPPEKITLFPNTVDIKKFTPGEKSEALCGQYGIGSKKTILLSVCRLCASETYKSYDVVLKALPKIRHAIPDIHNL
ncbi:MAG: glycosyltransferase, partial [Bacteroidota bacterium]